jgi:hypothetical protein
VQTVVLLVLMWLVMGLGCCWAAVMLVVKRAQTSVHIMKCTG